MKIKRSVKCSLKFANPSKIGSLRGVLVEYGRVVNGFVDLFWVDCPSKAELLKPVVDAVPSSLTARLRKVAAREAIDMIQAVRRRWEKKPEKAGKPVHSGSRMYVSSTIASLKPADGTSFDAWLHLSCLGAGLILDLPIKYHKQFRKWSARGKRLESYIITADYVQFCFAVETGPKQAPLACVGIDTGIKALASLSTGEQLGADIEAGIDRIKRCKHGSGGQRRASRALRQRMAEVAREVTDKATLIVVEDLTGITLNRKRTPRRRLGQSMRRSIGRWNVRYWLTRLEMTCEEKNVSFRSVSARYTSQTCSSCGYVDRRNRTGELFKCLDCGYQANADVQASLNILSRFLTGPYGAGCKPACPSMG